MTKKENFILTVKQFKRDFNDFKNSDIWYSGRDILLDYKKEATELLEQAKHHADNQFDLSKEQKYLINLLLRIERELLERDFL